MGMKHQEMTEVVRKALPGWTIHAREDRDFVLIIKATRSWRDDPDYITAFAATTVASRPWSVRAGASGYSASILAIVGRPDRVAAERTRRSGLVGSVHQSRAWTPPDIEAAAARPRSAERDAFAAVLAELRAAAHPEGVARRRALAAAQ